MVLDDMTLGEIKTKNIKSIIDALKINDKKLRLYVKIQILIFL